MHEALNMKGKVSVITGASRGIGREIANEIAHLGSDVALVSRKQEALDEVAADIREKYGVKAFPIACHCGKVDQINDCVAKIAEEMGRIDVLVNNAATNPHFGLAIDGDPGMFLKILETNIVGYFAMAKACVPHMDTVKKGSIVNLASVAGISPMPFIGLYSVSKAGVISLTKTLARELGPRNIRVNAVAPGLIKTDFSRALWSNQTILDEALKEQAIPRIGESPEPARMVAFLASDASSFTTGSVYTVDGGSTI